MTSINDLGHLHCENGDKGNRRPNNLHLSNMKEEIQRLTTITHINIDDIRHHYNLIYNLRTELTDRLDKLENKKNPNKHETCLAPELTSTELLVAHAACNHYIQHSVNATQEILKSILKKIKKCLEKK